MLYITGTFNGTTLIIKNMYGKCWILENIPGNQMSQKLLIPRLYLSPSNTTYPFNLIFTCPSKQIEKFKPRCFSRSVFIIYVSIWTTFPSYITMDGLGAYPLSPQKGQGTYKHLNFFWSEFEMFKRSKPNYR